MNLRWDKLVACTHQPHQCKWCDQEITKGSQMVKVRCIAEDPWTGKFHPECWRAEHTWWLNNPDEESWDGDGEPMARGAAFPADCLTPGVLYCRFLPLELTSEDLKKPWTRRKDWSVEDVTVEIKT